MLINKTLNYVKNHQFTCFVISCIIIACIMTVISLQLYDKSGAIKLDLSRPGYEKVRQEVEKESDDQPYEATGTLDEQSIKDFESRLNKYDKELKALSNYSESTISDENLGL